MARRRRAMARSAPGWAWARTAAASSNARRCTGCACSAAGSATPPSGSSRDVPPERPAAGAAGRGRRPEGIPLVFRGSRTKSGGDQRPPISGGTLREGPLAVADLVVAGAGMAGLCAAAEARARGADVVVLEKGDRAGGAMVLSSGVVWRHRRFTDFRAECPGGQPELQRLVFDRLDDGLAWLEELGAPVTERGTGNERTTGVRFDTAGLTAALVRAAGGVRCGAPLRELPADAPVLLGTGGFAASRALVREHVTPEADALLLRSTPWSEGDGLRLALAAGASTSAGMDEF